jgi:peptidoglycan-associated lipoprotein
MKKTLFISILAIVFLFTGCSQKTPTVDMTGDRDSSAYDADSKVSGIGGIDKEQVGSEDLSSNLARLVASLEQNSNKIYFGFDKFSISPEMQSVIEQNARLFNTSEARQLSIKVEGNCDEWGTDEYNYALGLKRAKSVKDALVAQGVDESRISIVSYGESNPECTAATKDCWDKNRRAEFKFLP